MEIPRRRRRPLPERVRLYDDMRFRAIIRLLNYTRLDYDPINASFEGFRVLLCDILLSHFSITY